MKPFKIEDAKKRFFNSKTEYLCFKQAWKDFHNESEMSYYKDVDVTPWEYPNTTPTKDRIYAKTKFTLLGPEHYLLYNILRGYDIRRGFRPLTNEGRLNARKDYSHYKGNPWAALEDAARLIVRVADQAKELQQGKTVYRESWIKKNLDNIRKPFGSYLTDERLITLGALLRTHITDSELSVSIPVTVEEASTVSEQSTQSEPRKNDSILSRVLMFWK